MLHLYIGYNSLTCVTYSAIKDTQKQAIFLSIKYVGGHEKTVFLTVSQANICLSTNKNLYNKYNIDTVRGGDMGDMWPDMPEKNKSDEETEK